MDQRSGYGRRGRAGPAPELRWRTIMKSLLIAAACLAAALTAAAQEGKPPSIRFSAHGAAISGATPNGHVVLLGVGVEPGGLYASPFRWTGVLDTDKNGDAAVDFGFAV